MICDDACYLVICFRVPRCSFLIHTLSYGSWTGLLTRWPEDWGALVIHHMVVLKAVCRHGNRHGMSFESGVKYSFSKWLPLTSFSKWFLLLCHWVIGRGSGRGSGRGIGGRAVKAMFRVACFYHVPYLCSATSNILNILKSHVPPKIITLRIWPLDSYGNLSQSMSISKLSHGIWWCLEKMMFQSGSGQGGCDCHPHHWWGRLLSNVRQMECGFCWAFGSYQQ